MYKKIFLFVVPVTMTILTMVIATSCYDPHKGCDNMPEQTVGTGLIIQNVKYRHTIFDTIYTPTQTVLFSVKDPDYRGDKIITSESQNIHGLELSFDDGATYQPIDFTKYTILGKYADKGACMAVFNRNVTKNAEQQKYVYKITVIHCGGCEKPNSSTNWVVIPKLEDDFLVEFIVEYKRRK